MPREFYPIDFPNLGDNFEQTSNPAYYNCVAYAVGDYGRKWWPGEYAPIWNLDYWPKEAPNAETVEAFVIALGTEGFVRCENGQYEEGFEKVAIYALPNGSVKHVAKQVGMAWRSKLGGDEDIEHPLEGLEGPKYGRVEAYLKRAARGTAAVVTTVSPVSENPEPTVRQEAPGLFKRLLGHLRPNR